MSSCIFILLEYSYLLSESYTCFTQANSKIQKAEVMVYSLLSAVLQTSMFSKFKYLSNTVTSDVTRAIVLVLFV